jgi:uridylate kinase
MAKAAPWSTTDAHARKRGEQTGLDTLVVHALNDVYWLLGMNVLSNEANA